MAAVVAETVKEKNPSGCPGKFSDIELKCHDLLTHDYPHSKFLTLSYAAKGNNFIAKAEGTLDFKGAHYSNPQPKTSSKLKVITNIEGRDVEAKFNNRGSIRLWANLGTYNFQRPATLSAKVKTDSKFKTFSYSANLDWTYNRFGFGTRVHIKDGGHPFLNQRVEYTKDNTRVGAVYKFSLATFLFSRIHFYGAYKQNDYRLYFQHDLKGNGISGLPSLGKVTLAATYKQKQYDYVLKTVYRPNKPQERFRAVAGVVAKLEDKSVLRAKINNNTSLALSWKKSFTPDFTFVVGSKVRLTDSSSFTTAKTVPIPVGFSLKFSQK